MDRQVACKSILLRNLLEDVGECKDSAIPLPNVTGKILGKVIEWCVYHKDDSIDGSSGDEEETTKKSIKQSQDISEWDKKYFGSVLDMDELFSVILAANYLDIKPLLDLGCKTVANMIKGKSTIEIRDIFGLDNDFTPEEEEKIRQENAWAEDI